MKIGLKRMNEQWVWITKFDQLENGIHTDYTVIGKSVTVEKLQRTVAREYCNGADAYTKKETFVATRTSILQ